MGQQLYRLSENRWRCCPCSENVLQDWRFLRTTAAFAADMLAIYSHVEVEHRQLCSAQDISQVELGHALIIVSSMMPCGST